MIRYLVLITSVILLFLTATSSMNCVQAGPPNVLLVLFDDLGYGQPPSYRAETTFRMPHFERLVTEGMRFTHAHSASAVCTPTRYGLLTGRSPFRIGQYGVLTTYSEPIIPSSRLTMASLLKQRGYHTACIGKWHLGLTWADGKPGEQSRVPVGSRLTSGPLDLGFDHFYGFTHARNIGTIIEGDRVVANVEAEENQPLMIRNAVKWIESQADGDAPFLLYFPMCPPHTPIAPAPEFVGKSQAEDKVGQDPKYGDWILQGDAMLGELLETLDRLHLTEKTLVIATSDNGAEHRAYPPLRESKRSIYEGGHRVPFVVRWPGHVTPKSEFAHVVSLNDVFATIAEIVDVAIPADAAEDSVSFLPALLQGEPSREYSIHQSMKGDLALVGDEWKQIYFRDGHRELYNLSSDLSETTDVSTRSAEQVNVLNQRMSGWLRRGRSTAGPAQKNDKPIWLMP